MENCAAGTTCMGRREFLVKAGLVAGATVLSISNGTAFASNFEDLKVPVGADSPLAKVGGSQIVDSSAGKLIVIYISDKKYAAFSAVCTHKRGILEYKGNQLVCPKHGSKFDTGNGRVIEGPAETPIKGYEAKSGDGSVTVALN